MKKHVLISALAVASLAFSGLTLAQGRNDPQDRHDQQQRVGPGASQSAPGHQKARKPGRPEQSRAGERGAGPDHNFYRGSRLPSEYRNRYYVVNDWRGHHLNAPPRGYQWVQTGGDYVLVRISNGIIFQIYLGQ